MLSTGRCVRVVPSSGDDDMIVLNRYSVGRIKSRHPVSDPHQIETHACEASAPAKRSFPAAVLSGYIR